MQLYIILHFFVHLFSFTGCPNEDRPLSFNLREFNFSRQLYAGKEDFVGRSWLYEDLKSTLSLLNTSVLLIIGEPGSGKSAVAANLICTRNSEHSIHENIIAYHLCQHYNKETQEPARFIKNIVDMMARRIPDYEKIILDTSLIEILQRHNCESDPFKCFTEAIAIPLRKVLKTATKLHYIVIDALDECVPEQSRPVITIVDLLKDTINELPKLMRIIATTRNDSIVVKPFRPFAKELHINVSDIRNLQDISSYIDRNLYPRTNFIDKVKSFFSLSLSDSSSEKLSEDLVAISQGNFLFVKLLVEYVRSDSHISSVMPRDLGWIYERYFRRVFPSRESFRHIQGVLEVLVSTSKPFRVEDVFETLQLQNQDLEEKYFKQDLDSLSQFLRYSEDNKVSLFHKSLMEWLVSDENKSIYVVSKKAGHRKLIRYYMEAIKNNYTSDLAGAVFDLANQIAFGDLVDKYQKEFEKISFEIIKNHKNEKDNVTFLHMAANIENSKVTQLFLFCFLENIDRLDFKGFTPAFISASRGFIENLKLLVEHGADARHKTNLPSTLPFVSLEDPVVIAKREFWNSTLLHSAAQESHLEVVEFLLKRNVDIDDRNGVGLTAIQLAAENGHLEIVKLLFKHGAKIDQLALHHAAMNGHRDVVKVLIMNNVTDECMRCDGSFYWLNGMNRYQSLWFDVDEMFLEHTQVFFPKTSMECIKKSKYSLVDDKLFLHCETPLHAAVWKGHVDVVRFLISRNDSAILCSDYTGRTPLHVAVRQNNHDLIRLLIDIGARVNSTCSRFQEVKQAVNSSHWFSIKKYMYLSVREEEEYFSDTCSSGSTPAHMAAQFGHIEAAQLLLHHDRKMVTKSDNNGSSLIHIAACYGQHHFVRWLIQSFKDVNINSPNLKNGSTPLHCAVACGNVVEIENLIKDGANVSALDNNGMSILHYRLKNIDDFCQSVRHIIQPFKLPGGFEVYFQNQYIRVVITWPVKTYFSLEYTDVDLQGAVVRINNGCRNFMELLEQYLSHIDDPSLVFAADKFGRTPLHIAFKNGLHCVTIVLMKVMPDYYIDEKFGISIWNYILEDLDFKDDVCQGNTLRTMYFFFEMFVRAQQRKHESKVKSSTLNILLRSYLKNGKTIKSVERWLLDMEPPVDINCNVPFLESDLHLLSYWPPASRYENLFFTVDGPPITFSNPGPLTYAVNKHPLGKNLMNKCRDLEGYTPLQRAAQGGNLIGIKELISWGADTTATTTDFNLTALELAVSYAGLPKTFMEYVQLQSWQMLAELHPEISGLLYQDDFLKDVAYSTSSFLLSKTPNVKVICDGSAMQLTIYHIAAYRGMFDFVKELLENSKRFGIEVDCPDSNGITPLYLAKLNVGARFIENYKGDPWLRTVKLIENYGGKLRYPDNLEAEHHLLYTHLYGSLSCNFNNEIFEYLLLLYQHDPLDSCFEGSGLQQDKLSYINCTLDVVYKMILNGIPSKGRLRIQLENALKNTIVEDEDKPQLTNEMFTFKKKKFDNYDNLFETLHDISNTLVSDNSANLKADLNNCGTMKLCTRLYEFAKIALLYFRNETLDIVSKDSLSFYLRCLFEAEFTKKRLAFVPILHYNFSEALFISKGRNKEKKTLVESLRYLMDIVLKKSTKFDYLDKLMFGISPGTRLFYQNTKIKYTKDDIESHRKLMSILEMHVGLERALVSDLRKYGVPNSSSQKNS